MELITMTTTSNILTILFIVRSQDLDHQTEEPEQSLLVDKVSDLTLAQCAD
jgi:hypothetical protein